MFILFRANIFVQCCIVQYHPEDKKYFAWIVYLFAHQVPSYNKVYVYNRPKPTSESETLMTQLIKLHFKPGNIFNSRVRGNIFNARQDLRQLCNGSTSPLQCKWEKYSWDPLNCNQKILTTLNVKAQVKKLVFSSSY